MNLTGQPSRSPLSFCAIFWISSITTSASPYCFTRILALSHILLSHASPETVTLSALSETYGIFSVDRTSAMIVLFPTFLGPASTCMNRLFSLIRLLSLRVSGSLHIGSFYLSQSIEKTTTWRNRFFNAILFHITYESCQFISDSYGHVIRYFRTSYPFLQSECNNISPDRLIYSNSIHT